MATSTALAAAFFRLYILHALDSPARPVSLLTALHAREGALPVPAGGFSRALQQLLDAGLIVAGPAGALQLTPMGERERQAQRTAWERLVAIVGRVLAGELPGPEPPTGGGAPLTMPRAEAAESCDPAAKLGRVALGSGDGVASAAYRERVVVAEVRDAMRRARDDGRPFAVILACVSVAHPRPAAARAMLHRALRETLGTARATFGAGAVPLRYGANGVALIVPERDAAAQAELLRARLAESLAAMRATVHAYAPARFAVRVGSVVWSPELVTSGEVLRLAEERLGTAALEPSAA